jgi:uncharacterized protein YcbX
MITVRHLYRYPVKGLSPEPLDSVRLEPGETIPFDRAYAIENGPGRFDPTAPKHLPKINFLMLMRNEKLAALETAFDAGTQVLTIYRDRKQVARGDLSTRLGRQMIEQFFAGYMSGELKGAPRVVNAAGHSFSDVAEKCLHLVNLETVRSLSVELGQELDPLRFRANVYFDGLEPWAEHRWLDRQIHVGGALLEVFSLTPRCAATDVDPDTATRDTSIPPDIQRMYGHNDLGLYAKVVGGGEISVGDEIVG